MNLYLAGPMRGYPEFNFPAFHEATGRLRALGHWVWSPAEHDVDGGFNPGTGAGLKTLRDYMKVDLVAVLDSDAVAVLPGWRESSGASLEAHVATACGIPVLDAATLEPVEETVCAEADRLVATDRQSAYGHPLDDFSKTAAMWSALLGAPVQPEQVGLCMIAVKLSREQNAHKRDNLVDIAGYAKTVALVHEERARRAA